MLTPEEQLRNIFDALAESVMEATDEEIMEEIRERGEDPAEVAERVRKVLLDAIRKRKGLASLRAQSGYPTREND